MSSAEVSAADITKLPYRCIGLALAYLPDGRVHQGTFALVGRNDFLTATHMVIDDAAQLVQRIDFFLGVDLNRQSGHFSGSTGASFAGTLEFAPRSVITWTPSTGSLLAFPTEFNQDDAVTTLTESEAPYDLALIGVNQAIGDEIGWLDMNPLIRSADDALSVGYPQDSPGMMARPVSALRSDAYDLFTSAGGELRPGDSGGPLMAGGDVIGVASGGTYQEAVWAALAGRYGQIAAEAVRNDSLLGGATSDTLRLMRFDYAPAANDSPQWLQGYSVSENLEGGGGSDTLLGAEGDDTLNGGDADDLLYGDSGEDVLIGGRGNDTIDGGDGSDAVSLVDALAGVLVDLSSKKPVARSLSKDKAGIGIDQMLRVEHVTGSAFNDRLLGDGSVNHLEGRGGDDTLSGGKGDDVLNGGTGRDVLSGGAGADIFRFAAGDSGLSISLSDVISDFKFTDGDRIRLEALADIRCTAAQTPQKNFSLALVAAAEDFARGSNVSVQFVGKNALLLVDGNQDAAADLVITLIGIKFNKAFAPPTDYVI